MNLSQIKSIFPILVIFIIIVFLALFASTIFFSSNDAPSQNQSSPTEDTKRSTVIPPKEDRQQADQNTQTIIQTIIDSSIEDRKGDLLLYQTDTLEIEYIPSSETFYAKIFTQPINTYKIEIQNWFIAQGLNQSDLCTLPLRILIGDFDLKLQNPDYSSLPDGC